MKRLHFLSMTTTIKTFENTANYFEDLFSLAVILSRLKRVF